MASDFDWRQHIASVRRLADGRVMLATQIALDLCAALEAVAELVPLRTERHRAAICIAETDAERNARISAAIERAIGGVK